MSKEKIVAYVRIETEKGEHSPFTAEEQAQFLGENVAARVRRRG